MPQPMEPMMREVFERVRRIETRLTKYLEQQGFDTQVKRAQYHNGAVLLPSPACSMSEVLAAIPPDHFGSVALKVGDDVLGHIIKQERN